MKWNRLVIVLALSLILILGSSTIAAAKPPGAEPTATLLVTGLEELQGSAVGPGGDLFVTAPLTGSIWRVDPKTGAVTLFASGLPARIPDFFFIGSGVVDVAFHGGTAYALVTGVGPDLDPGQDDIVGIYRVDDQDSFTIVADIGDWSIENPPATDFFVPSGFQYAIEPFRGGFLVTDGHHNRVLRVTLDGEITEVIAFGNVVPTGLALRGNTVYVAQAGPIPHLPEDGKVVSFTLKSLGVERRAGQKKVLMFFVHGSRGSKGPVSEGGANGCWEYRNWMSQSLYTLSCSM